MLPFDRIWNFLYFHSFLLKLLIGKILDSDHIFTFIVTFFTYIYHDEKCKKNEQKRLIQINGTDIIPYID